MNTKDYIYNCSIVKTILMLLIIVYHSCVFWTGQWWDTEPVLSSKTLGLFATWLNSFHVFAFTLVSGYLFAFKVLNAEYDNYIVFIKLKAKRLIIPYVFVMLIWVAPISAVIFHWDFSYLFRKFILCIDPSQLWFLWMLFEVFVIVWPMRKLLLEKTITGWLIAIAFYGLGIIGKRVIPNIFCIWTTCQYVPFFFIGMRIRVKEECGESLVTERVHWLLWIVVDLVIFAGTIIVGGNNGTLWSMIAVGLNLILHIVGAVMAWITLQALANKVNWKSSRAFRILSSYSMPMYLFHQQIIYFAIICLNGKVNPWINAGVNFVVAIMGSFLISSILMHWKGTRFLIGEK